MIKVCTSHTCAWNIYCPCSPMFLKQIPSLVRTLEREEASLLYSCFSPSPPSAQSPIHRPFPSPLRDPTALMSSSSSRDKMPSKPSGGIRTLADLNRPPSAPGSDSDSDGPQEYYTGGEKRYRSIYFQSPPFALILVDFNINLEKVSIFIAIGFVLVRYL